MLNDSIDALMKIKEFVSSSIDDYSFDYWFIPISNIFPVIPNKYFKTTHTDKWLLFDNEYSFRVRDWITSKV